MDKHETRKWEKINKKREKEILKYEERWRLINREIEEKVFNQYRLNNYVKNIEPLVLNRHKNIIKIVYITIDEPCLKEKLVLKIYIHRYVEKGKKVRFSYKLKSVKLYYQKVKIKFSLRNFISKEEKIVIFDNIGEFNKPNLHHNSNVVKINTLIIENAEYIIDTLLKRVEDINIWAK